MSMTQGMDGDNLYNTMLQKLLKRTAQLERTVVLGTKKEIYS